MRLEIPGCFQRSQLNGVTLAVVLSVASISACVDEPGAVDSNELSGAATAGTMGEASTDEAMEGTAVFGGEEVNATCSNTCEDICTECAEHHRCPSDIRYHCVAGGCPPSGDCGTRTTKCACCGPNQIRSGTIFSGTCVDCPPGQIATEQNQCCLPLTRSQACGSRVCGSASNGCGGTLSCGTCPSGKTCSSGQCVAIGCTPGTCRSCGASQVQTCNAFHTWNPCNTGQCP
jgi:hypothetical protein